MDIDWPDDVDESEVVPNIKACAQDDQPASFKKERQPTESKRKSFIAEIQVDLEEEKTKRKEQKKQMKQDRESSEHAIRCRWLFISSLCYLAIGKIALNDQHFINHISTMFNLTLNNRYTFADVINVQKEFETPGRKVFGRTAMEGLDIYSAMVAAHVAGLAAAWDQHRYVSAGCIIAGYFMQHRLDESRKWSDYLGRQLERKIKSKAGFPINKEGWERHGKQKVRQSNEMRKMAQNSDGTRLAERNVTLNVRMSVLKNVQRRMKAVRSR